MSENKIDSIVEELRSEEERIKKELSDLKKREQEVTKELKTVQSGLAVLTGKTRKRSAATKTVPQETPEREAVKDERSAQRYSPAHSGAGNGSLPSADD